VTSFETLMRSEGSARFPALGLFILFHHGIPVVAWAGSVIRPGMRVSFKPQAKGF
jgi:hypothetical protein